MAQQNLDFNIVAHTKGMEQIASLINRVGALEKEIKKVQQANAGLASSSDTVIRNGIRYNNAMDAQAKALRNARQGTQQLGMQINDFATSITTGASLTQAFNQQIGQVGFAMSMMGGTAGRIGAFLAGPWGAAITIATMALAPYINKLGETISKLFEVKDAAQDAMNAFYQSLPQANNLTDALTAQTERRVGALATIARTERQIAALRQAMRNPLTGAGAESMTRQIAILEAQAAEANATLADTNRQVENLFATERVRQATAAMRVPSAESGAGGSRSVSGFGGASQERQNLSIFAQRERLRNERAGLQFLTYSQEQLLNNLDEINKASNDASASIQQAWMDANPVPILQQPIKIISTEMQNAFDSIGASVDNAFKGMITGATGWRDAMRGIIQSVIDQLWKMYVTQQIVGFISGALKGVGMPMPAGKAVGGAVSARTPYMVGEKGPELFIPGGNGTIIPNNNVANGNGGNVISINVDARGSTDAAAVRAQVQRGILEAAPSIIAAAQQKTVSDMRRPRLGGVMQ